MTKIAFFTQAETETARAYIERDFGKGAFDPVVEGPREQRDLLLVASVASARDYFRQSEGLSSTAGEPLRLFPAMVDATRPNAFAVKPGQLHICGMHVGMYAAFFEMACHVMAQPNVCREVGDPDREVSHHYPEGFQPAFWLIDQTAAQADLAKAPFSQQVMPKCPERSWHAQILTLLMLRFVWFHELFHCLNGHAAFLSHYRRGMRLNECADENRLDMIALPDRKLPLSPDKLLKALELDADRSALYGAYRVQLEDGENIVGIQKYSRQARCELVLLSAFLVIYIIEQVNRRFTPDGSDTHPDSYTRLHDLVRCMASNIRPIDEKVVDRYTATLSNLESLADVLPGLQRPERIIADFRSDAFQEFMGQHERDLRVAREAFYPFGYREGEVDTTS